MTTHCVCERRRSFLINTRWAASSLIELLVHGDVIVALAARADRPSRYYSGVAVAKRLVPAMRRLVVARVEQQQRPPVVQRERFDGVHQRRADAHFPHRAIDEYFFN